MLPKRQRLPTTTGLGSLFPCLYLLWQLVPTVEDSLCADVSRARAGLDEGLRATIAWYAAKQPIRDKEA